MSKLNIGCADELRDGWVNIDSKDISGALRMDARNVQYFFSNVEEIYAGHVLEHMLLRDAVECLIKWAAILVPGGKMEVRVPDMDYAAELVARNHLVNPHVENDRTLMFSDVPAFNMIWGDDRESPHKCGFTMKMLKDVLKTMPVDFVMTSRDYEGMREIRVVATKKSAAPKVVPL